MTLSLPDASRSAACDAVVTRLDAGAAAGTIKIYTGAKPASANSAPSGTLLATFTLADPAFSAAVAGVADLDAEPDLSTTGVADGTAGWFRAADSDGNTVMDGEVGTSGKELNLTSVSITTGGTVTITSGTVTMSA